MFEFSTSMLLFGVKSFEEVGRAKFEVGRFHGHFFCSPGIMV